MLPRCIGWKIKPRDGYHMLSYADALANTGCENVEMALLKQIILFAGLVARMDNKRLHKRTVFGEPEGGKGYLGGQEQDWMGCLESDLQLFNWPIDIRGNRKKKEKGGNKKKTKEKRSNICSRGAGRVSRARLLLLRSVLKFSQRMDHHKDVTTRPDGRQENGKRVDIKS